MNDEKRLRADKMELASAGTQRPVKRLRPTLTLHGREERINVGVDTIRALNAPEYVCLLRGVADNTIAIVPCEEKNLMSFRVPMGFLENRHRQFRINSKSFVHGYLESLGLNRNETYTMEGRFLESKNMVVFGIADEAKI